MDSSDPAIDTTPKRRIIVVDDEIPKEAPKPHTYRHQYQPGALLKSGNGAQYKVDEVTGAFHRLNPSMSKKARRKAEQRARRKH